AGLLAALTGAAFSSRALAIERNPPPQPGIAAQTLSPPNAGASDTDSTPFGPQLRRIVLLGANDGGSLTSGGAEIQPRRGSLLDNAPFAERLRPFLGQPISRRLIAEIETVVAEYQREAGYPFVSISTPPQEISSGVVEFRVIEFHTGTISVVGGGSELAPVV